MAVDVEVGEGGHGERGERIPGRIAGAGAPGPSARIPKETRKSRGVGGSFILAKLRTIVAQPLLTQRGAASTAGTKTSSRKDAARRFLIAAGHLLFHRRNYVFPLVFGAVALASRPRAFLGSESADAWLDLAGILVILSGQALRVLVIGLTAIEHEGKKGRIHSDDLIVEGIFRHSRNPLYLGNLLVFAGLFLVLNSPAGWLVGAPFFLFTFWTMILAEEEYLERTFGAAYQGYRRGVRRFLPSFRGWGLTMRTLRFDGRRVIGKEYGSTFAWITTLLLILVWERFAWRGQEGAASVAPRVLSVWAVAIAGYATARGLKRTGRLNFKALP